LGEATRRNLAFFFAGIALAGTVSGITDTSFNSFLNDVYHLPDTLRGLVEFPRELPGFLVTFVYGALVLLPEHQLGVVSMLLVALGLAGLALCIPRVFIVDIHSALYRIAASGVLGVVVLLVAFLYNRYRGVIEARDEAGA
jgi:hypothetical protein